MYFAFFSFLPISLIMIVVDIMLCIYICVNMPSCSCVMKLCCLKDVKASLHAFSFSLPYKLQVCFCVCEFCHQIFIF